MTVTNSEIGAYVDSLSDVGTPSATDELLIYDVSASVAKKVQASALTGAGSAGALILIDQLTASAHASLAFTNLGGSTYDELLIEIAQVSPATNAVQLFLNVSTNGGSSYDTTSAHYGNRNIAAGGGVGMDSPGSSHVYLSFSTPNISNAAAEGVSGYVRFFKKQTASSYPSFIGQVGYWDGSTWTTMFIDSRYLTGGAAIDALQFIMSSGNISTGTIRIYGVAK